MYYPFKAKVYADTGYFKGVMTLRIVGSGKDYKECKNDAKGMFGPFGMDPSEKLLSLRPMRK